MWDVCYNIGVSTKHTSLRLSPILEEALSAYLKKQNIPPSKTAVISKALAEFLAREGFLQEPQSGEEILLKSSR